jgi:hypothetical protein
MALGALVITLTLAAFLGVLQNGFVNWDDPVNFLNNPSYRGLDSPSSSGCSRPSTWVGCGGTR